VRKQREEFPRTSLVPSSVNHPRELVLLVADDVTVTKIVVGEGDGGGKEGARKR
jgi:hypothetical protein